MNGLKLVIRYADGRIIKGTSQNFHPQGQSFHLQPTNSLPHTPPIEIHLDELKGVFFVETFEGRPDRRERKQASAMDVVTGRMVEVRFTDGEKLVGSVMDYNPNAPGFFLFPIDSDSNNHKVYVVNKAVREVLTRQPQ